MGTRGPAPKRDDQRAGHNAKREQADKVRTFATVPVPDADADWHADAIAWYEALAQSGQSKYFEPSDWQLARLVARMLTALLTSSRPSAELFKAVGAEMDKLGVTEGARRRQRIEVHRPDAADSGTDTATADAITAQFKALAEA